MTNQDSNDIATPGVDSKALANLIVELNISRRHCRSYPKGHQVIDAALNKVLNSYAGLKETGEEVVIGVACDALLLGDTPLEKSNLIYRDFARVLYERGIGALVLHRGLGIEELRSFIAILGAKREDVYAAGGIEKVWETSGIVSIEIRAIRYDLFMATEELRVSQGERGAQARGLWEQFARGIVNGSLAPEGIDASELDPELLAEALNQQFCGVASSGQGVLEDSEQIFQRLDQVFARGTDQGLDQGGGPGSQENGRESELESAPGNNQRSETHHSELAYRKLASFVGKLAPGLRRQFLNSTFDIKKIKNEAAAEGLIRQLSADAVIETLQDINENQVSVPPFILGLLQQMHRHSAPEQAQPVPEMSDFELHEKMRTIFKEHAMEEFIPDSYRHKLDKMISAEQIPLLGLEGVHDLMDTFDVASMESKTSDILLLLLSSGNASAEDYAGLASNLNDISTFFLQTGDYPQLVKMLRQIGGDTIPVAARRELQSPFVRREFLEEVLDGLGIWGKARFAEIGDLIWEIGAPFIEVLLDRLALADSMSLRRYLMDRLLEFGGVAGPAIIGRLSDERWYFLRNLITLVRQLELGASVEKLRTLARHPDPRVSQEALKVLLQFNDPEAESRIVKDLGGKVRDTQLAAVRMAGKSNSTALLDRLHAMLLGGGLSGKEAELKCVVVQSLGEIASPRTLPVLETLLASRSILHPMQLKKLKLEVAGSLGRYPAAAAGPILAGMAQGSGALAQHAAQLLRGSAGRAS